MRAARSGECRPVVWGSCQPRAIIRNQTHCISRLTDCHDYFLSRLKSRKSISPDYLEATYIVVVDRLSLVGITCDEQDNPHLIFESLNAKGEKLTPADLIRNFLLMRIHVDEQQSVFDRYWKPIQDALNEQLTEFVRHYLMKEGKIIKSADIYFELKDRLNAATSEQAKQLLADLHLNGIYYASFINPSVHESDVDISAALHRLRIIEATVAYPFLLRVFDAYHRDLLSRPQLLQVFALLESFLIRRSVCGYPSNQLRKILPPIFDAVGSFGDSFVAGLREQLGGKRCPDDKVFSDALMTQPLYASAKKSTRLRLMLERLEQSFDHKEPANFANAQIEHVMPQTLTPEWLDELGDEAHEHHARLLHTLGNLTLTGYNPQLSNLPYLDKKKVYKHSHFELNKSFDNVDRWTPAAIEDRARAIAKMALKIWSDVGRDAVAGKDHVVGLRKPVAVRFQGQVHPITTWKEGAAKLLELFETAKPGHLAAMVEQSIMPADLSIEADRFHRSKILVGGVFVNTHASGKALQLRVKKIMEYAGIFGSDYEFVFAGK